MITEPVYSIQKHKKKGNGWKKKPSKNTDSGFQKIYDKKMGREHVENNEKH